MMRFRMGCLHWYVLKSWFMPFMGILALVTSIFLLQKILIWLPKLIENDVPAMLAIELFSGLLPSIFLMVLPVSYFFALYRLVKYLQGNSELDAMYASGLSLFNIFAPILWAGLLLSALLLWMNMQLIPASKLQMSNTVSQLKALQPTPSFIPLQFTEVEGIIFYSDGKNTDGSYSNVLISDSRESATDPQVYLAKEAFITQVDTGLAMSLKEGNQISGAKDKLNFTGFDEYIIQIPLSFEGDFKLRTESTEYIYMRGHTLYEEMEKNDAKSIAEWYKRWAPSFTIIILFFLAVPLALQAKRSQKGGSFIMALVVLSIIDQSQYVVFLKMGLEVLPLWSLWSLETLFAVIAVFLFLQVDKYGNLSFKHMKKVFS